MLKVSHLICTSLINQSCVIGRVLVVMSTILFLLCTAHVGVSLQQLLDAFVYAPADVPDYSTTYWLDYTTTLRVLKNNLFISVVRNTYIYMLVYRSHAEGETEGVYPTRCSSKFNMATMMEVLICALFTNEIWRLYVVFMCNWKVVIFPVCNTIKIIYGKTLY